MSSTLAWIASVPAFNNLRGSYPLPIWSFPSSMYLRVAAANSNCNSVLTFTLDTPKEGSSYTLRDIIKASLDRNQYDVADAAAMQFVNTSFPMTGDNFFQMQPGTLNVTKD